MSEKEFNEIFSKKLRYYLELNEMTQAELAKRLDVGKSSVSNWVNGTKSPRMSKVDAMCEIFHCTRSDLIAEEEGHYVDPETIALAQKLYQNPEMHMLFDAVDGSSPSEMKKFYEMVLLMKREENPTD